MDVKSQKILIAEDDAPSRIMLRGILHDYSNIFEATDGVEAMSFLARNPDTALVLLDYLMPRMDGLEVLTRMRMSPYLAHTPVLLLSGAAHVDLRTRALKLGATDFATKPYHGPLLRQRVANLLRIPMPAPAIDPESFDYEMFERSTEDGSGIAALELSDGHFKFLYASNSCAKICGYTVAEFAELSKEDSILPRVIHPDDYSSLRQSLEGLAADRKPFCETLRIQRKDGSIHHATVYADIFDGAVEQLICHAVVVPIPDSTDKDVSRTKPLFPGKDGTDALTGLPDRISFFRDTRKMLDENRQEKFVLIISDIDRFKVVNDLFGTRVGDNILRQFAARVKSYVNGRGTFGRYESDKFCCCMPERDFDLNTYLKNQTDISSTLDLRYNLTVHNGIYPVTEPDIEISQMCDRAKIALSSVKGNYIQRYAFYDESMRQAMLAEQQILNDMHAALENGDFVMFLQPVYSLHFDKIVAAEALIRWNHPQHGLVSPGQFIPLFEKNRFITNLDHYMWEKAAAYLAEREKNGLTPVPISVNVSRMNLFNTNLPQDLLNLLKRYRVKPTLFRLEITESAYMDNPEQLIQATTALRDAGFTVLIDDFGSGYSSLKMLKDIPLDILKIDMKFLDNLESSSRAAVILLGVISIAQHLGMATIAEGVETKFQLDFLRTTGCDNIQGFYFSKPLPVKKFERLLMESPILI